MSKSLFNEEHNNICYLCHIWNYSLDRHHLLTGVRHRTLADDDGLYIYICRKCHNNLHSSIHYIDKLEELKQMAQRKYEETHTRDEFVERYKKSYL